MQRLSLVNLFVDDVDAAVAFYAEAFGWDVHTNEGHIAFFQFNGFVLGLMSPRAWEDEKTGIPPLGAVTIAINVRERSEVDDAFARAVEAGATIAKEPGEVFWGGYSCYVTDPWGNVVEIAQNPFWEVTDRGETVIPS